MAKTITTNNGTPKTEKVTCPHCNQKVKTPCPSEDVARATCRRF